MTPSDVIVLLIDDSGIEHSLLFEVEQSASGRGLAEKIVRKFFRMNQHIK